MTAPTIGFGATRPQPRRARSGARSMAARPAGAPQESEPNADPSEGMCRFGIEVRELRDVGLVLARLQANLAYELHRREGESTIHEHYGARVRGVDHDCPGGGRTVIESDVRIHRLVAVDPDSGRDIHQDELPARNRTIAVAFEIHGEFEVVPSARSGAQRTVTKAWHSAMHPAHRDRGDREAAVEH